MMNRDAIRSLREEFGPDGYLKMQAQMLGLDPSGRAPRGPDGKTKLHESYELPNGRTMPRKSPSQFSIRALWEGLEGPVEKTLSYAMDQVGLVEMEIYEEVGTGAFPSAVGQLIASQVIESYEDTSGFIGDMLVRTMDSNLRGERVVGFTAAQAPKEVGEMQPYKEASFGEKFVGTRETKRGRLISVSEEAVFFDQTGQMLDRAREIGFAARQNREKRIVQGVLDHDSGNAIYQPSGSAEQLYSAGNNNLRTGAGALVDWTDIQEALDFHANNVTSDPQTDDVSVGEPLVIPPPITILTSKELAGVAARIVTATISTSGSAEAPQGAILQTLAGGDVRALSSPFINAATSGDRWDDNSDWLIGNFQMQFRYKEIWPLQTFRAPAQNDAQFERDVVARFKVREYGDVLATDERWVVKNDVA